MTLWHLMSPPSMAVTLLTAMFLTLIPPTLYIINYNTTILLEWEILTPSSLSMSFPIMVDKFSLIFNLTVVLISLSVMLFSNSYMSNDPNLEYFIYMVMLFVLSMSLLILIPNLFFLLLGWDGLGLTSYLLVIYYQNDKSLGAGMVTALTNRIGDALLILASAWAFSASHWNLAFSNSLITATITMTIMVAAMTKSAQLPFSAWLPAAMAAPTPVSSLVHSSTLVTAGVYLLIRFYPTLSTFSFFTPFMFFSGTLTCMMAGLAANYEYDFKKVIALSTLSQLGVMMLTIGLNQPILAFFHLITHALFKALLFICAGTVIHSKQNTQDLRMMGNLWNSLPATCTALNVANLALCGLPFLAGFYSKDLIVETWMMNSSPCSTSILLISSVCLTSAYSIRMSILTLWSPFKSTPTNTLTDESTYTHTSTTMLLMGATTGGALLAWLILPSLQPIVLPTPLKTLTLTLILVLALVSYLILTQNKLKPSTHFMSSMWFLGTITSSPHVSTSFNIGNTLYFSELTWWEYLGGGTPTTKGPSLSKLLLQTQWHSLPTLMRMTTIIALLSLYIVIHYFPTTL